MNQIIISGNATRDPETFGKGVTKFGVAVNGREKKDGEWVDRADFFTVICFGRLGEVVAEYLTKGQKVAVRGRMQSHEYQEKTYWEVIADEVDFMSRGGNHEAKPQTKHETKRAVPEPEPAFDPFDLAEDDLPF